MELGEENLIFWQHPNAQRRAVLPVLQGRGESGSTRKTTNARILRFSYSRSRAVKGIWGRSNWIYSVAMGKPRCMRDISLGPGIKLWLNLQAMPGQDYCNDPFHQHLQDACPDMWWVVMANSHVFNKIFQYAIPVQRKRYSWHGGSRAHLQLNHPCRRQETQETMMSLIEWSVHLSRYSCLLKCRAWGDLTWR